MKSLKDKSFTQYIVVLILVFFITPASSHHSFAIYDIDNKIQRTGVLSLFRFSHPHVQLQLKVDREDGTIETWNIESMNPRRWDRSGLDRKFAKAGDTVTVLGWPARDGTDNMVLSSIITDHGEMVITERIRQRRARENIPATTIKRD